jgi:hypothetical protein
LQQENTKSWELCNLLRYRSEPEAYEIYRRIRNSDDPVAVL